MPGIDGMQLFQAIHREHPALPVIILTAHGTIPDAVSATQRGVFGFLTKPSTARTAAEGGRGDQAVRRPPGSDAPDAECERDRHAQPEDGGSAAPGPARRRVGRERADLRDSGTGKELLARPSTVPASAPTGRSWPSIAVRFPPSSSSPSSSVTRGRLHRAVQAHRGLFQTATAARCSSTKSGTAAAAAGQAAARPAGGEVRPLGATQSIPVDVRVISATHRDLEASVRRAVPGGPLLR